MLDENQNQAPNAGEATGTAFAEIPFVPAASALCRPMSRKKFLILSALAGAAVIGVVMAYFSYTTSHGDPNAPRVVAEVSGMHCPIQCGLRVASALEQLPFVLPGSVDREPEDRGRHFHGDEC